MVTKWDTRSLDYSAYVGLGLRVQGARLRHCVEGLGTFMVQILIERSFRRGEQHGAFFWACTCFPVMEATLEVLNLLKPKAGIHAKPRTL